jgi:NAD(P)-dependent dehydrogenase (short-subunit alcohol dehydrogenase family)
MSLRGKAALVTGGGSGIGLGCARALVEAGMHVTICGRDGERLRAAAGELGGGARWVVGDVLDEDQVREAVRVAAEPAGALHVSVINAGGAFGACPLVLMERERWDRFLGVNLTGAFLTLKHSAASMVHSGGGAIVAVSSIAGGLTHRYLGAYAVAKAGLEMLVRNAADELGGYGVRVNAVRPGLVPTEASHRLAENPDTLRDYLDQMPLGRTGTADEVAAAVRFLAGEESSWITGQVLGVDGGHGIRRGPDLRGVVGDTFDRSLAELLVNVDNHSGSKK